MTSPNPTTQSRKPGSAGVSPADSGKATSKHASETLALPDPFSRRYDSLKWSVWIAAAFCTLVSVAMLYQHSVAAQRDPWKSPALLALKQQLRAAPNDDSIKSEIRRLDLEFRARYVRRLSLNRTGGWLLVGGLVVLVLAGQQAAKLRAKPWLPKLKTNANDDIRHAASLSRRSVAAASAVVLLGLATLAFTSSSPPLTPANMANDPANAPAVAAASLEEFRANWPRFRGFDGSGVATFTNLSLTTLWQSPIPAPGHSSPVGWGNRLFISGGDATKRQVFCYDTTDGKLLWQRAIENVPGTPSALPEIPDMTGFASPTMATDGRSVFVHFANGDLAALSLDGAPVWSKNIGVPKNMYGHATSLAIWPGKLIVQFDQDEGASGGSKLLAFDCASGRAVWERSKPTHGSWATPIIIEAAAETQIITLALPFVMSHSLTDGNELWRAEVMEGEITPSPIFANGLVLAVNPSVEIMGLKPDGAGEVSKTHVAWRVGDRVPDVTSPVSNGKLAFTVTSSGVLACLDLQDGKKIWEHDLEMEVQSSPSIAGNQLLVFGTKGVAVVVETAREFREIARAQLADQFLASPAFANGRMYLRGETNLWCLGHERTSVE